MRLAWSVLLIGCSAPAKLPAVEAKSEAVGDLKRIVPNDCPSTRLSVWSSEVFPACPPPEYETGLPICRGSVCAKPCATHSAGYGASMPGESYEHTTRYTYDAQGRFESAIIDGKPRIACNYAGDRIASCRFDDDVKTAERDSNGRLVALEEHGQRIAITYDAKGRVTAVGIIMMTYDERGWLARAGRPVAHDDDGHVTAIGTGDDAITFTYDGDRIVSTTGPGHANSSLHYDAAGRLLKIAFGGLESSGSTMFEYDCK